MPVIVQTLPPPEPTDLGRPAIEQIAQAFAQHVGYRPGDDLDAIVKRLGGRIEIANTSHHGEIEVRSARDFTIYLPPHTGHLRNRFTIAHELGHYVLHAKSGRNTLSVARNLDAYSRVEAEANAFAAALLMPENVVLEVVERDPSIAAIAARCDVSMDAVAVRCRVLGLTITD
ncbi:MAG: ImmA/IrrE family metallo-endopeptidase [Verrucomicrobiota bacterium]